MRVKLCGMSFSKTRKIYFQVAKNEISQVEFQLYLRNNLIQTLCFPVYHIAEKMGLRVNAEN